MSDSLALFAWGVKQLPTVDAALNATATVLLVVGLVLIRQHRERAHKVTMLAAFAVSITFLICYLVYHAQVGSRPFGGSGAIRVVYFVILVSHILLAITVPFLAVVSIYFGWRDRRMSHRRVVHWAYPIWLYVSITGVIIYVMLYHLYPPVAAEPTMPAAEAGAVEAATARAVSVCLSAAPCLGLDVAWDINNGSVTTDRGGGLTFAILTRPEA